MLLGVGVFVAVGVGVVVDVFVGVSDGVTVTIIVAVGVGVGLLAHAKPPAKPTAKRNSPKGINTLIPRRMGMILDEKRIRRNWLENWDQGAGKNQRAMWKGEEARGDWGNESNVKGIFLQCE